MQIKLEALLDEMILGENIDIIKITFKNNGSKDLIIPFGLMPFSYDERLTKWYVIGSVREECKQKRLPAVKLEPLGHEILKVGAEKSFYISLAQLGIVHVGNYEIWIEYDNMILPSYWDEVNITRMKVESNHIKIKLKDPNGIDAEIFNKYKSHCNQMMIYKEDILEKYPTSTYAG
jgi:hypothetical protein